MKDPCLINTLHLWGFVILCILFGYVMLPLPTSALAEQLEFKVVGFSLGVTNWLGCCLFIGTS